MRTTLRTIILASILTFAMTASPSLAAPNEKPPPEEPSAWDQVLEYYEKAKEAGEQVPQDVYEWAKQDLSKIGDWEYRVETVSMLTPNLIQDQLNRLGADRWECIWVEQVDNKTLFIFKRPIRSYLQNLSLSQLMKLVPRGDSGDSDASGD